MAYRVKVSRSALADVEDSYLWMKEHLSEAKAVKWYNGLVDTVYSLEEFPRLGALAPESDDLSIELRQLLYGKRSSIYRILYTIHETDKENMVHVHRIWHGARDRIQIEDLQEQDEDTTDLSGRKEA
jgi:plasmid stabilization system protein ParE